MFIEKELPYVGQSVELKSDKSINAINGTFTGPHTFIVIHIQSTHWLLKDSSGKEVQGTIWDESLWDLILEIDNN